MMLLHDANGGIQSEAGAIADAFGGEERIENPVLNFRRDAWAVVANLDDHRVELAAGADSQFAVSVHGVDSIVDQVRPYLIQFTAIRADPRQFSIIITGNG